MVFASIGQSDDGLGQPFQRWSFSARGPGRSCLSNRIATFCSRQSWYDGAGILVDAGKQIPATAFSLYSKDERVRLLLFSRARRGRKGQSAGRRDRYWLWSNEEWRAESECW